MRLRDGVPLGRSEIFATILRKDQLGCRFRQMHFADVLHQALHVRERWHVPTETDTTPPDADELLLGVLHERFVDAPGNIRNAMLGAIKRILELVITLIPTAFVNLGWKARRAN